MTRARSGPLEQLEPQTPSHVPYRQAFVSPLSAASRSPLRSSMPSALYVVFVTCKGMKSKYVANWPAIQTSTSIPFTPANRDVESHNNSVVPVSPVILQDNASSFGDRAHTSSRDHVQSASSSAESTESVSSIPQCEAQLPAGTAEIVYITSCPAEWLETWPSARGQDVHHLLECFCGIAVPHPLRVNVGSGQHALVLCFLQSQSVSFLMTWRSSTANANALRDVLAWAIVNGLLYAEW
nr:hypothetical protein Iba_chr04dCG15700 [Ipomoea batatas]